MDQQDRQCGHTHLSDAECIRLVPIFNHLEDYQMSVILKATKKIVLQKGDLLFRAGEKDNTLYLIHTGKVRIYQLSESGKEQLVRILNPGDFTGELVIFQPDEIHVNYAEAMTQSSICTIQQDDLSMFLEEYPKIALKIISEITARLKNAERQTLQVSTESVEARIISFLMDCLDENSSNNPTINLPISKKDLASYLGTTPETISRKFTSFEQAGLIKQLPKNIVEILDLDKLLLYSK